MSTRITIYKQKLSDVVLMCSLMTFMRQESWCHDSNLNFKKLFLTFTNIRCFAADHSCGYCSLLPNLRKGFGWNPGKKMNHWFGEQLRERTGDYDITFKDVSQ